MRSIKIIKTGRTNTLVEWTNDAQSSMRAFLNNDLIKEFETGAFAEENDLDTALPYGFDFTQLTLPQITSLDVSNALHDVGLWTKDQVLTDRKSLLAALARLYGPIIERIYRSFD